MDHSKRQVECSGSADTRLLSTRSPNAASSGDGAHASANPAPSDAHAVLDFAEFLHAYVQSRLPSGLRRYLGPSDIVQSVFFIATKELAQFRGNSPSQMRGWLVRIAERKIIDKLKRHRDRTVSPEAAELFSGSLEHWIDRRRPDDHLSDAEEAQLLLRAIEVLPHDVRKVILLRHHQQLTFDEISEELSISVTTCRRRWSEGLDLLKISLGPIL